MPKPQSSRDLLAELMNGGQKTLVPHIAEMMKRTGIETVDTAAERERFWQRALTPAQEAEMWNQEAAARGIVQWQPGSPEVIDAGLKISKAVYPSRWDMSTGEGREHESEVAEWAYGHAKKGPPAPKADEMPTESVEGDY